MPETSFAAMMTRLGFGSSLTDTWEITRAYTLHLRLSNCSEFQSMVTGPYGNRGVASDLGIYDPEKASLSHTTL